MMTVVCPHCGRVAATIGIGRPSSNIGVTVICDNLRLHRSVAVAAKTLGCSRALVYKLLKVNGLTVKKVLDGVER